MARTFDAYVYGPGPTASSRTVLAVPGTTVSDERYEQVMAMAVPEDEPKKPAAAKKPAAGDGDE